MISGVVITLLMHLPHFQKDLMSVHVWRQTQTQSNIDNFYEEDGNILNPRRNNRGEESGIFRMEFPLMQWLIAGLYSITGQSILVTRLFMFLTGLGCIGGMFAFLNAVFRDRQLASLGAWAFCFSPAFYYYMINPLPDVFALALGLNGIALVWGENGKLKYVGLGLISLATMCKLPFILFMAFSLQQGKNFMDWKTNWRQWILWGVFLIPPALWYAFVVPAWKGNGIVQGLMDNQVPFQQLGDYFLHNLVSTVPELLVNYAGMPFFLTGLFFIWKQKKRLIDSPAFLLFASGLIAYFLFELNMIAKVHDYYLFPFYPALFLIITYGVKQFRISRLAWIRNILWLLLLILPLTAWLRMQTRWNPASPGFNPDLLTYKEQLRTAVPDTALCIAGNDESGYIFFYYVHKKGWAFQKNEPLEDQLKTWHLKGAKYLYSDSEEIDERARRAGLIDTLIQKQGSIRVYKLR